MAAQVGAALGEDGVQRAGGVEVERHEHRRVLRAGDRERDRRRRGRAGRRAARPRPRRAASDQLHPLVEGDLALERPVDGALGRDHLQPLDLLLGEVRRASVMTMAEAASGSRARPGVYSQSTVSPATSQPLRLAYISIVIAVHEASEAASSSCGLGPAVVAAVVLRLVGRDRVRADLDVVAEVLELRAVARIGAHDARPQSSGLKTQAREDLGEEVGRLRRHHLAGRRDLAHELDRAPGP